MKTNYIILLILLIIANTQVYSQLPSPSDDDYGLYGIWARRAPFGSAGSAEIRSSVTDEDGNVYLSGLFEGTLNFSDDICNPVMSSISSSSGKGFFLLKLDNTGKYQWHTVYELSVGSHDPYQTNLQSVIYDYKDGKLLLYGRFIYLGTMPTIGVDVTFYELGSNNSPVRYTKPTNSTNYERFYFQFLHVVNVADGSTETFLDPFTSLTHSLTARFQDDNIHVIHMGWDAAEYSQNNSIVSIYNLNGNKVVPDISYPDQPYASPGYSGCGSTIVKHVTLADGRQVMVHNTFGKTGDSNNVPAHYLLYYSPDYGTRDTIFLMSERAIQIEPLITTDNSSNLYITTNYGWSSYWDSAGVHISNSNYLNDYLGSGNNYLTKFQANKIVLSRMNPDNSIEWMFQIGVNDENDGRLIVAKDMKTVGNYTYVVGQLMGENFDFNGGRPGFPVVNLSNTGNGPPNWGWNWDIFYAIYDNEDGNCVYAVNMGDLGAEDGTTIFLSPDASQVLIGGTYSSSIFQSDPSERLYPITSNGTTSYGYVTKYSIDPNSQPATYPSSFGDAPESYGIAVHHMYNCIDIGYTTDMLLLQSAPDFSVDANTARNDNGIDLDNLKVDGFVNLNHADFNLGSTGDLKVKVRVNNMAPTGDDAKLIGWIDFNQNGIFDGEDEASSVEIVSSGTSGGIKTLTWSGVNTRLRNGTTYLRLRLTTDHIDRAQPQGLFFNGEVEDYRLDFNLLELAKTAVSNNIIDPRTADIGDTITYTISLSNKYKENVLLFDPIPEGTVYYDSDPAGTLTNISLNGNTVQAITWNLPNLEVSDYTYKFRAIVTHKPENSDSIVNIAYATIFGDTISSSASNSLASIEVNKVRLINDTVYICENNPTIEIDVLANDYYLPICDVTPNISATPSFGNAVVNSNRKVEYTPNNNYDGTDIIKYTVECSEETAEASIFIIIHNNPAVVGISDLSVCLGEEVGDISLISNISGTIFDWTGGSSAGLQDGTSNDVIPGFKAVSSSAIVHITPRYTYPTIECIGDKSSFEIGIKGPSYSDINNNEYLWTGVALNGNSWNTAENWLVFNGSVFESVNAAPDVTTNVRIMGYDNCVSDPVIISDENSVCNDITITGTNLILNNSQLNVYGNWNNDGIFTPDNVTTIIFTGDPQTNRTIKSNGSSFTNIKFDFNGKLRFLDLLTITKSGEFSNGIAYGNAVFMENSTSIIPQNSTSFINGEITRYGSGLFIFPLGDINIRTFHPSHPDVEYEMVGRLSVTPGSSSNLAEIKATYLYDNTDLPNWWHTSNNMEAGLHHVSDREYWKLSSNVDIDHIALHWQDNDYCAHNNLAEVCPHGFCNSSNIGYVNLGSLTIAVSDGGKWRKLSSENNGNHDNGYLQTYEGLIFADQAKGTPASSKTYFVTFGTLDESVPLPIELIEFKANALDESIELTWVTATEINNDYFEIERSIDAVNFEKIYQEEGSGFSNIVLNYSYEDFNVETEIVYYYRLKQTDFDNSYKYFPIKSAVIKKKASEFSFYPNPASDYIELVIDSNDFYYEIISNSGQVIFNGKNNKTINISELSSGLYSLKIVVDNDVQYQKFIKE